MYNYKDVCKKGSDNAVADTLSRLVACVGTVSVDSCATEIAIVQKMARSSQFTLQDIALSTASDPILSEVVSHIQGSWPCSREIEAAMRPYYQNRHDLSLGAGCILKDGYEVVLSAPYAMRKELLSRVHFGHPGIVRTKSLVRSDYWWLNITSDVAAFCRHCGPCQASDKSKPQKPIQPISIPKPAGPWEKLAIDVSGRSRQRHCISATSLC